MQEYIWVLCEELDPTESFDETSAKNIWAFNDFESAKAALRQLMRARACTENNVFDGKGGIRGLTERIQEVLDWNEGDEREENGRAILKGLHDLFIEGKTFPAEYRIDRITDIRLLDTPVKPKEQVEDGKMFSLPKHMAEHLYMFSGESVPVTFRMKTTILNDVIDWFGTEIAFFDETKDEVTAHVTVNWNAMRHWALQYCRHIKVLAPENLVQTVKNDLQEALDSYQKGGDL